MLQCVAVRCNALQCVTGLAQIIHDTDANSAVRRLSVSPRQISVCFCIYARSCVQVSGARAHLLLPQSTCTLLRPRAPPFRVSLFSSCLTRKTHTHTHTHTHIHTHTHTHTNTHTHANTHTYTSNFRVSLLSSCFTGKTLTLTHTHSHTHIHTHTNTNTHANTHTYVSTFFLFSSDAKQKWRHAFASGSSSWPV